MANSFPDPRLLLSAALGMLLVHGAGAETEVPTIQRGVPITIDARSSDYDYSSSRLAFQGLRLDQGTLGVQADYAETAKLDFDDGVWVFRGNVVVEADNAILYCDEARLTFLAHELTAAELSGAPARFQQTIKTPEEPTQINTGEANQITYKLELATLELREEARFTDGTNSIAGDLITYDLQAQNLRAGSGDSGPVKITIEPSRIRQELDEKQELDKEKRQ